MSAVSSRMVEIYNYIYIYIYGVIDSSGNIMVARSCGALLSVTVYTHCLLPPAQLFFNYSTI